jgi:hypothetical protein
VDDLIRKFGVFCQEFFWLAGETLTPHPGIFEIQHSTAQFHGSKPHPSVAIPEIWQTVPKYSGDTVSLGMMMEIQVGFLG